jgi:hypothetical protein
MVGPLTFGVRDVAPAGEGEATGDTYYDDGTGANPEGLYVYTTGAVWQIVGGGGGVQSTDVNTSGMPTLGPIDLINGPGIALTRPAPGQVQVSATALTANMKEKPWEYHDLTNLLSDSGTQEIAPHNSMPSQRCITQGADGRIYILWHDNRFDADFGDLWRLYLTVYYANTITGRWDTITYELILQYGDPIFSCLPYPKDFCLCMDGGVGGLEMLHILFIADDQNADPNTTDVFDAYYPTSLIGRPPSATVTQITLIAEKVNQIVGQDATTCSEVSAAYQPGLSAGPGIVVVWKQYNNDVGLTCITSNIYDPTQAVFSRYKTGISAYRECIVNDPNGGDCSTPTIECSNNNNHCCYLMNDGGYKPYYSNLKVSGIETVPNTWDNIMLLANGSIDDKSAMPLGNYCKYTSMVIIYDGQGGVMQDVIVLAVKSLDRGVPIHVYTFSEDIASLPAPSVILADMADVYDDTKPFNGDDHCFQVGCDMIAFSPIPGSPIPRIMIYKEMVNERGLEWNKDFVLLHRTYNTLGKNDTEPFYHVPLECTIADYNAVKPNHPTDAEIRFHPKVHYSNQYNILGWNTVLNEPWYPYNVYHHLRMGLIINGTLDPYDVMIINDKINLQPPI